MKMSKKHNLSVKKGRDLLRVILLLLWFVKKPKVEVTLSEKNEVVDISGISFIPGDFIVDKSIFLTQK
jgi:hypothetical protein